jgi:hypothetical protein
VRIGEQRQEVVHVGTGIAKGSSRGQYDSTLPETLEEPVRLSQAHVLARWALLVAVVMQLTDGLTFAAGLRLGVPLRVEANPLARHLFADFGLLGVIGFKLAGIALILVLVGLAQRVAPHAAAGRRRVIVGSAVVGIAGILGTVANLWALLPALRVA